MMYKHLALSFFYEACSVSSYLVKDSITCTTYNLMYIFYNLSEILNPQTCFQHDQSCRTLVLEHCILHYKPLYFASRL